jgi:hypothetical protein
MALIPLRRGDFVTLTIGSWTQDAMVGMASPNSVSLAVLFDGAAPLHGGEHFALGAMALLYDEDTQHYYDLVTHTQVIVNQKPR